MFQVRLIQPSDAGAVRELLLQLGYDVRIGVVAARIEAVLSADQHYAAIAQRHGTAVGLIHLFARPALEKPSEAVVQMLVVEQSLRGLGIGKMLMAEAETWARTNRLGGVSLHTRVDRLDACRFYERLGYRRAATSHYMRKELAAP